MDQQTAAHEAFTRREWQVAYDGLKACAELGADDLDALGECAHWLGLADEVIEAYTEAYRLHVDAGTPRRAALSAFMLAIYTRLRGQGAQADGWLARAQRLLAEEPEGAEHGYPLYLETARLMGSDLDAAVASAHRMQDLGRRFSDDTLVALGVFFEGRARIKQARVRDGLALLDEAMLAALSDKLKPMWTGAIYCGLLDACHELADVRRAEEWTEATSKWCSPLPVASLYPGICRVHRAEILHHRGAWEQAETEALEAVRDMADIDVFVVADGYYEVGEIRRRRGDLAGAEEAFTRAHEIGRDPQPGLALLRLAQGKTESATASIAAALAGFGGSRRGGRDRRDVRQRRAARRRPPVQRRSGSRSRGGGNRPRRATPRLHVVAGAGLAVRDGPHPRAALEGLRRPRRRGRRRAGVRGGPDRLRTGRRRRRPARPPDRTGAGAVRAHVP